MPYSLSTTVTGISASGLIVGTVLMNVCDRCPYPPDTYRGFIYQSGTYQIVNVDSNTFETWITGINNSDQVCGYYQENNNFTGSFLLQDGQFREIGITPNGPFNQAMGINNLGEIVGVSRTGIAGRGFAIINGVATSITVKGQQLTAPQHVNDAGVIVGYYVTEGLPFGGFIYAGGAFTPLNYPGATATLPVGINNNDVIVGTYTSQDGSTNSFLVNDKGFHQFALPGACSTTVTGINNQGVVYGSTIFGTECTSEYGFVATPK